MAIENPVLNALIDSFRGEAERLRGLRARIDSLVARWYLLGGVANDATAITETRPDVANLNPLTGENANGFAAMLVGLKTELDKNPDATFERFAVRAAEFDR